MAKKKRTAADDARYKRYQAESRWKKNRIAALLKHHVANLNDVVAAKALDNSANFTYRRNKFKNLKREPQPTVLKQIFVKLPLSIGEQLLTRSAGEKQR